jgi:hypothetical protein
VISLRHLVRLLPLLAAALLLLAQPVGTYVPVQGDAFVASHGRDAPSRAGDIVTRKQRHAASLEEYFAVDDDPDQSLASSLALIRAKASARLAIAPSLPCRYRAPPPSHRACAAPPTGPPFA